MGLKKREKGLVSFTNPESSISEQYRTIRTNLFYSSKKNRLSTMVITSTDFGEGKTTTAVNLAISIVYQGAKVLLVDADLRNPMVHHIFSLENNVGLADLLTGEEILENVVHSTDVENLEILTAGSCTKNPADLLTIPTLDQILATAQKKYDVVIFDSPPVLKVTDVRILANKCDGTILVLSNEKTKREDAVETKRLLELAGANCIGVIFNNK